MRVLSVNPNIYGNSNRQQNKQIQIKQNPVFGQKIEVYNRAAAYVKSVEDSVFDIETAKKYLPQVKARFEAEEKNSPSQKLIGFLINWLNSFT